jgi:hypothetical protein
MADERGSGITTAAAGALRSVYHAQKKIVKKIDEAKAKLGESRVDDAAGRIVQS